MTSTEGLYIRHSDMTPDFYQANGYWMLPALFLMICFCVFAVIRLWIYIYEYYVKKRGSANRRAYSGWSMQSSSPML